LSQNKTNGKHFFQFEVKIVARQIGFDESQQKFAINISFNLKIMEAWKIGFDESTERNMVYNAQCKSLMSVMKDHWPWT
jgi:hypothetical protein